MDFLLKYSDDCCQSCRILTGTRNQNRTYLEKERRMMKKRGLLKKIDDWFTDGSAKKRAKKEAVKKTIKKDLVLHMPPLPSSPPSFDSLSLHSPPLPPMVTPWFKDPKRMAVEEPTLEDEQDDDMDKLSEDFDTNLFLATNDQSDDETDDFEPMERIPVTHWKHVIYNLLVENHNDPKNNRFCFPWSTRIATSNGQLEEKVGFRFDVNQTPARRLAELWATYEKDKDLEESNLSATFKEDLYKYYLRAALDLLAKYFIKHDKFTFLYDGTPLFVPNGSAQDAIARIKTISARNRKKEPKRVTSKSTTKPKAKKRATEDSFVSTNFIKLPPTLSIPFPF